MARRAVTLIGSLPVLPRHKIFLVLLSQARKLLPSPRGGRGRGKLGRT
jgi:hypothetical protein